MSEVITNMKVRFGADTKNFKKGLDEGKGATKQFKQDAGSAFNDFAAAFGVNMKQINDGFEKMKLSLTGLTGGFKTTAAGSNIFTRALGIMKAAIISTGIGALVVALGSLVSYFTKTQEGADFVSRTMKAIGAVTNVLVDRFSALGKMIFEAFSNPKQAISDLWEAIKINIVNRFTGLIDLFQAVGNGLESLWKRDMAGLKNAAAEAGTALIQLGTGLDESQQKKIANGVKGIAKEIKEETKAAIDLEKARQALEKREIAFIETESRLRKEIAALRLEEKDHTKDAETRLAANRRANELVMELEKQRSSIQAERIRITQQEIELSESMNKDYRALAEEKAKLNNIETQSLELQRSLAEGAKTLTKEIEAQAEAVRKLSQEQTKMFKPLKGFDMELPQLKIPELETEKLFAKLQSDLGQSKSVIVDFAQVFNDSFGNMALGFADSMANMLAGTGDVKSFGDAVKSAFGTMAVEAGRIIVSAGFAFFAIGEALKKALKTPAAALAAVAAGVALMAVGKAAQASLSNIGSGGGGGSIASNSFVFDGRGSGSEFGRIGPSVSNANPLTVQVVGTFRQQGSDLVAVINETAKRKSYTG